MMIDEDDEVATLRAELADQIMQKHDLELKVKELQERLESETKSHVRAENWARAEHNYMNTRLDEMYNQVLDQTSLNNRLTKELAELRDNC
jgi:hypothetical protein